MRSPQHPHQNRRRVRVKFHWGPPTSPRKGSAHCGLGQAHYVLSTGVQSDRPRKRPRGRRRRVPSACLRHAGRLRWRTETGASCGSISQVIANSTPGAAATRSAPLSSRRSGTLSGRVRPIQQPMRPSSRSPSTSGCAPDHRHGTNRCALCRLIVEATWEYNDTSLDAFTTRLTPTKRRRSMAELPYRSNPRCHGRSEHTRRTFR